MKDKAEFIKRIQELHLETVCPDELVNGREKTWVFLVSHELSATGAPVALFNLAVFLKKRDILPVVFSPVNGKLSRMLENECIPVIIFPEIYQSYLMDECSHLFSCLVVNSIVGAPLIRKVSGNDYPVIWWIHESEPLYLEGWQVQMPVKLGANIHVLCVGPLAAEALRKRRPAYQIGNLLYYCRDFREEGESDETNLRSERLAGKTTFLNVASVEKNKGQDILVKALDYLEESVRESVFITFIGRPGEKEQTRLILQYMKKYPQNIIYLFEQEQHSIFKILEQTDCFVCASRYDSMPIAVTEAMIASKPIICSAKTGMTSLIRESGAGFVFEENSPQKLAGCITEAVRRRNELSGMGENARRIFEERFSEAAFERDFNQISFAEF